MTLLKIMNSPLPSLRATSTPDFKSRLATLDDVTAIAILIRRSAHGLRGDDYSAAQIEAALEGTYGVDTGLIGDQTYWVIESESHIVAAGGWSLRAALCGGDGLAGKDAATLDPATDAARIRAFFVDPEFARCGLGNRLLSICETEAARYGFQRLTLLATLPGRRLYRANGYTEDAPIETKINDHISMTFVPMHKTISPHL
jgi:GNAT superfamily N-acetyltransferase